MLQITNVINKFYPQLNLNIQKINFSSKYKFAPKIILFWFLGTVIVLLLKFEKSNHNMGQIFQNTGQKWYLKLFIRISKHAWLKYSTIP